MSMTTVFYKTYECVQYLGCGYGTNKKEFNFNIKN